MSSKFFIFVSFSTSDVIKEEILLQVSRQVPWKLLDLQDYDQIWTKKQRTQLRHHNDIFIFGIRYLHLVFR